LQYLILGAGYTGACVAQRLHRRGLDVIATHRSTFDATRPGDAGELARRLSPGCRVLHSIPVTGVTDLLEPVLRRASRIVYLSTTGVYGAARHVDETTPPAPRTPREHARVEEERSLVRVFPKTLILRPAAIYGPGRGVHVALRNGTHRLWGDGSNYISRIHADDLAAIAEAALLCDLAGAFPVADDHPCPAREISDYCCEVLGLPLLAPSGALPPEDTRAADRRVDGRAIRRLLGVALEYPSYRVGIPACLSSEAATTGAPPSATFRPAGPRRE